MFTIEIQEQGKWRRVRFVQGMTEDEANSLLDAMQRWDFGNLRKVRA